MKRLVGSWGVVKWCEPTLNHSRLPFGSASREAGARGQDNDVMKKNKRKKMKKKQMVMLVKGKSCRQIPECFVVLNLS